MRGLAWLLVLAGCGAAARGVVVQAVDLPGGSAGVFMDYLAYDRVRHRLWVPAGNTGSVDVVERDGTVARIDGFPTAVIERRGHRLTVGPSSATVGDGVVYVGNRADFSVCAIDAASLRVAGCVKLMAMPDGLQFVHATREVWVTVPSARALMILDVSRPAEPAFGASVSLDGEPEGFAVDEARGRFHTNLEDKDRTLTIDLRRRELLESWEPRCGEDGPRGLALDAARGFLVVACPDHLVVLDAGRHGAPLSTLATGAGVDAIDYVAARREVYAAAARAARLTVARLDDQGRLTAALVAPTADGARNAVASDEGVAYLTDSIEGKILVVPPQRQ